MSPYRDHLRTLKHWLCRIGLHRWRRVLGSGMHGYEERCDREHCGAERWAAD